MNGQEILKDMKYSYFRICIYWLIQLPFLLASLALEYLFQHNSH